MSIEDLSSVDGLGVSNDKKELALLLSDHLDWDNEYEHLVLLQDKINAYISFIDSKQYESIYPQCQFEHFVIEIHFMHNVTDNCCEFINAVSQQIEQLNTVINYCCFTTD